MSEEQDNTPKIPNTDDDAQSNQHSEQIDIQNLSYAEYLKLTNPDKSDEEIAKMVRKENRYTWLGRFQILAFIAIIIVVIVLIVTNNS